MQVIAPDKAGPGAGPDLALHRHPPMHRTVGISPGRGPGREPPPHQKEPYLPSPGFPRRIGSSRGESPGRAQAWEGRKPGKGASLGRAQASLGRAQAWEGRKPGKGASLGRAQAWEGRKPGKGASLGRRTRIPLSYPPPPAEAVQVIVPESQPRSRPRSRPSPASSHAPDRRDITRGGGRGGNPLPAKKNRTGPPPEFPRRSGSSRGEIPGRAQAWESEPGYRFPIPRPRPRPALLPRPRLGQCR